MADMDDAPSLAEEHLSCGICLRLLCRPYALICGHTYCGPCVVAHEQSARSKTCPSCRSRLLPSMPSPASQLNAYLEALRPTMGDTVAGESLAEWKERMFDWDARAAAELAKWQGFSLHESQASDDSGVDSDGDEDLNSMTWDWFTPAGWQVLRSNRDQYNIRPPLDAALPADEVMSVGVVSDSPPAASSVGARYLFRMTPDSIIGHMMRHYCRREGLDFQTTRFHYTTARGTRVTRAGATRVTRTLRLSDTPRSLGMRSGDLIDAIPFDVRDPSVALMGVTVPDNVHAGERMVVMTPSGDQYMVVVPEGSGPGSQFQIAVPRSHPRSS
jgi:hypothetical protein